MKKILAFLLTATLLCAMFVLPSAAADNVNYEESFDYAKKAPTIDGTVKTGEYGVTPIHTYSESKSQFTHADDHDDYNNWDFSFYGVWDENYVYMAWVVKSEVHAGMPEEDMTGDGVFNDADTVYMWPYSCVQFIFTPGAPKAGTSNFQTSDWSGDYLEVGLGLTAEGNQIRVAWSKPNNATALNVNDWDAVITRSGNTTTYEVRIPWSKSGLKEAGNGAQFGLTYAVAAQENYEKVKKGMIEWQDGVLGKKNADNAAVITLTGNEDIDIEEIIPDTPAEKAEGEVPEEAKDKVQILLDGVDKSISTNMAYLYTNAAAISANNNSWATSVLLVPVEGEEGFYTVEEVKSGDGTGSFSFDSEVKDGMIAISVHTDGTEGSDATKRLEATKALTIGSKVGVFGVDFEKKDTLYKNAMIYVVDSVVVEDESSEVESSEVESSEVESSKVESSKVESSSAAASSEAPADDDEGSLLWLWIVIGVVVVAGAAVAVVVLKKKK